MWWMLDKVWKLVDVFKGYKVKIKVLSYVNQLTLD